MSYLALNGLEIPVSAARGRIKRVEIGKRGRSFKGRYQSSIRKRLYDYDYVTTQITSDEIDALSSWIEGAGQVWSFDSTVYSSGGLGPSGTPVYQLTHNLVAEDGTSVYNAAKFGGALGIDEASTNMLTGDQRTAANAPTGYTSIGGATLTGDATIYWVAAKSLKIVNTLAFEGAYAGGVTASIGDLVVGSVFLKGAVGGENITLSIYDGDAASTRSFVQFALTTEWVRYRVPSTTLIANTTDLRLSISVDTISSTVYADGFQLEEGTATYPSSFYNGATKAAASFDITRLSCIQESESMSLSFWTHGPRRGDAPLYFWIGDTTGISDATNYIAIQAQNAAGAGAVRITAYVSALGGASIDQAEYADSGLWEDAGTSAIADVGTWRHIGVVVRRFPSATQNAIDLYVDGTVEATLADESKIPDFAEFAHMLVGYMEPVATWAKPIVMDDLCVVPYAMTAGMMSAIASGEALSGLPYLNATGDFNTRSTVDVDCEITNSDPAAHMSDGTWDAGARAISFKLHERG